MVFPGIGNFGDVGAVRGVMVGEAVAEVEDGGDGGQFEQRRNKGGFVHGVSSCTELFICIFFTQAQKVQFPLHFYRKKEVAPPWI